MSTPKKKHLIELMIEAGVKWPDGAEYAAQDECSKFVNFYSKGEPDDVGGGGKQWMANNCEYLEYDGIRLPSLCRNWHKTIVTREQYAEALAEHRPAHLPARQPETFMCRCVAAPLSRTIEQLTADYHAKAAEADRLQAVADEALKAADDALIALEKAGELIGLVISIDTNPKQAKQPEITGWRDLRVGDVIWVGAHNKSGGMEQGEYEVRLIDDGSETQPVGVIYNSMEYWPDFTNREWRFIRRP